MQIFSCYSSQHLFFIYPTQLEANPPLILRLLWHYITRLFCLFIATVDNVY
uniref:Uncharacterized protein n=1 Tax=Arundo donax TaxID=35708 RepID=A0A0A9ABS1_ARUDO